VPSPRDVGVVIVAAGRGVRFGGSQPKQYLPIAGVPMLLRAIRPFSSHPDVRQVVVVLPPEDVVGPPSWLAPHVGAGLCLVPGGAERSDSVACGLAALLAECKIVLVHDAARPFVTREVLDAVISAARAGEGAVPALPVADTLKQSGDGGHVARTVPRDGLWRAQTPQGFPRELIVRAHARAKADGVIGTDDAFLVERLGGTVRLVAGDPRNMKVTTADDLALAEVLAGTIR
jgi:2-C-methyl-D-erythritol 4-phosphate cytidylyltransferase